MSDHKVCIPEIKLLQPSPILKRFEREITRKLAVARVMLYDTFNVKGIPIESRTPPLKVFTRHPICIVVSIQCRKTFLQCSDGYLR